MITKLIYPGSLMVKRWIKVIIIMTVGVSCFVSDVQEKIFEECEWVVRYTDTVIAEPVMKMTKTTQATLLPVVKKIEQSRFGQWLNRNFDVLSSKNIEDQVDHVHAWGHRIHNDYIPLLQLVGWSLKIGNWILIVVIAFSYFWLICDASNGPRRVKWVTRMLLVMSLPVNLVTYVWLTNNALTFFLN